MAGIEKVCEYSGEYHSHDMYMFKKNHIQIHPMYRKKFRGQKAELFIFKKNMIVDLNDNCYMDANLKSINANPTEEDWNSGYAERDYSIKNKIISRYMVFYENLQEYKDSLKKRGYHLKQQYEYVLFVPGIRGEVNGFYVNYSTDISTVKRKLSRLVGSRNLTIKNKSGSAGDFINTFKG